MSKQDALPEQFVLPKGTQLSHLAALHHAARLRVMTTQTGHAQGGRHVELPIAHVIAPPDLPAGGGLPLLVALVVSRDNTSGKHSARPSFVEIEGRKVTKWPIGSFDATSLSGLALSTADPLTRNEYAKVVGLASAKAGPSALPWEASRVGVQEEEVADGAARAFVLATSSGLQVFSVSRAVAHPGFSRVFAGAVAGRPSILGLGRRPSIFDSGPRTADPCDLVMLSQPGHLESVLRPFERVAGRHPVPKFGRSGPVRPPAANPDRPGLG